MGKGIDKICPECGVKFTTDGTRINLGHKII